MTRRALVPALLFVLATVGNGVAQRATEFVSIGTTRVGTFTKMEYPVLARSARVQGAVVIRATLNNNGAVSEAVALSGPGVITEAAVANATKLTFEDAPSTLILVYLFEIDGACTGPDTFYRWGNAANVIRITTCSVPYPL